MAAVSSERAGVLETLAVKAEDGPCVECVRSGRPVTSNGSADVAVVIAYATRLRS
jgi:hypothetical protein